MGWYAIYFKARDKLVLSMKNHQGLRSLGGSALDDLNHKYVLDLLLAHMLSGARGQVGGRPTTDLKDEPVDVDVTPSKNRKRRTKKKRSQPETELPHPKQNRCERTVSFNKAYNA